METLQNIALSAEVCTPDDMASVYTKDEIDEIAAPVRFVSNSTNEAIDVGTGNAIHGADSHETMCIGVENSASRGGLALGYWCRAEGEDCIAIGCGARASGEGWANNAAIGRHASVSGKSSVQLLMCPGDAQDRAEGRDYNTLSAANTLRFRSTVVVGADGKIPAESLSPSVYSALSAAVEDLVAQRVAQELAARGL